MENKPKPVTLITGFLGAGKTTLLNEILQSKPDTKFLIIENEVGEINVDRELIDNKAGNKMFELSDGCICCSLNSDLGTLLNQLILSNIEYDYVLIEATGMADPSTIVRMFSGLRSQKYFKLDGVVCLVDAGSLYKRLDKYPEVRKQIAQSEIVLLNKTDLASEEQLEKIERQIKSISPIAQIERASYGKIDTDQILNRELFHHSNIEKSIGDFSNLSFVSPVKEHAHKIQTFSFTIPGDFVMQKFSWWLENFLIANPDNILQIKGIISFEGLKHKIALQSVGDNFHISQGNEWSDNENRGNRLVFIGINLDKEELEKNLNSLLFKAENIVTN